MELCCMYNYLSIYSHMWLGYTIYVTEIENNTVCIIKLVYINSVHIHIYTVWIIIIRQYSQKSEQC